MAPNRRDDEFDGFDLGVSRGGSSMFADQQRLHGGADHSTKILGGLVDIGDSNLAGLINTGEAILSADAIKKLDIWKTGAKGQAFQEKLARTLRVNDRFAGRLVTGAIYGLPAFYVSIFSAAKSAANYGSELRNLNKQVEPFLAANRQSAGLGGLIGGTGNNEVLQVARKRVRQGLTNEIYQTLTSVPSGLVKMFSGWNAARNQLKAPQAHADNHAVHGGESTTSKLVEILPPAIGSAAENYFKRKISQSDVFKPNRIALDYIIHLDNCVKSSPGESTIQSLGESGEVPLKKFVREIFLLHQRNMGEPEIGRKNAEKLDYACEQIAEMIRTGKMSAWGLVSLVGERHIVLPNGQGVAGHTAVDKALEKARTLTPAHFSVDVDQFWEDSLSSQEDAKGLLASLKERDRDLFILVHPQDVMEKLGVSKKEYGEAEHRMARYYPEMLWKATQDLASMDDKELKREGFERREIAFLRRVADETRQEPHNAILSHVSTYGQYKEGIEFLVSQHTNWWRSVANGECKIGGLCKKARASEAGADVAERESARAEGEEMAAGRETARGEGRHRMHRAEAARMSRGEEDHAEFPDAHLMREGRRHEGRMSAREHYID
jgi:hypothetical protein